MIVTHRTPPELSRRAFVGGTLAASMASAVRPLAAQTPAGIILSGGTIVTMDARLGDLTKGDIHIRDGAIVAVAPDIDIAGTERIDVSGTIVMPGLVDTHWHMWNTIARGLPSSRLGPFARTMGALAANWTPEASALGVRLALAEAVNAGITTTNNWAHNTKSLDFAEAELAAQLASGVRGRFSYGYPQALTPENLMDLDGLATIKARHFAKADNGLVRLGVCVRGPDRSVEKAWRAEWAAARDLKLPLTTHIASDRAAAAKGSVATLHRDRLLGPDIQLVHATHASADDFARMAEAGSPLSLSPWTELEVGYGLPALGAMAASNVGIGLSVDNMVLAGHADMFGVMRITADLAAGLAEKQLAISDRRVLEWATVGGARTLGYGDLTGSLTPGKRADIIAVRTDALGTAPFGTVDFFLTHVAQPAHVDFVMIDGQVHKRGGRLTRIDVPDLLAAARETIADLRSRAGI